MTYFFNIAARRAFFYSKLRHAESFSLQIWPSDGFEFETPVLRQARSTKKCVTTNFWLVGTQIDETINCLNNSVTFQIDTRLLHSIVADECIFDLVGIVVLTIIRFVQQMTSYLTIEGNCDASRSSFGEYETEISRG